MAIQASATVNTVSKSLKETPVVFFPKCVPKNAQPSPGRSVSASSDRVYFCYSKHHDEKKAETAEPVCMTARQMQHINRLIASECCNYVDGICIVQDRGYGHHCPQMGMRTLFCPWLREAVLPLKEKLRHDLIGDIRLQPCEMCLKKFSPKSNRARFCPSCSVKNRKIKQAEWVRKKRLSCRRFGHPERSADADFRT